MRGPPSEASRGHWLLLLLPRPGWDFPDVCEVSLSRSDRSEVVENSAAMWEYDEKVAGLFTAGEFDGGWIALEVRARLASSASRSRRIRVSSLSSCYITATQTSQLKKIATKINSMQQYLHRQSLRNGPLASAAPAASAVLLRLLLVLLLVVVRRLAPR